VTEASDGSPALVMELLHGETLGSLLQRERVLSIEACASLMLSVVSVVGMAHELGIMHRDLKPANVFVTTVDGKRTAKVLDFGIARVLGEAHDTTQLTETGVLLGTPAYMAPEQLFGEPFDHRADVWAVGAMTYEMLTGELPTRALHLGQVMKVIMASTSWNPADKDPSIPAPLADAVSRMLSRDPSARPADLREMFNVFAQYSAAGPLAFGAPLSRRGDLVSPREPSERTSG
jgi:serine/threonine-protein kinase